jgi:acyl carrier protein
MKEQIRTFISNTLMFGEGNIEDDEQLFETGAIDSLGFIKLLTFIEKTFNVQIDMSEVTMDKFGSINDIEKTIQEKLNN